MAMLWIMFISLVRLLVLLGDNSCSVHSSFQIRFTDQTPINNGVEGEPHVSCMADGISVEITSKRSFAGRVFVKGLSTVEGCMKDYTKLYAGQISNRCNIRLYYGTCNINRQRAMQPKKGVTMLTTVIVQYHPVFLTKIDRAYSIRCFYQEEFQSVSSSFEVSSTCESEPSHCHWQNCYFSMIPTTVVADTFQMPVCSYSVRQGSFDGPPVSYVSVGDTVYHRWDCKQTDPNLATPFGMLVHSCYVNDGVGNKVLLVDSKGCSMDPYIMGHLRYSESVMSAAVESHVFKFADRSLVYFQCQIRLCIKTPLVTCEGITPPKCSHLINKRQIVLETVNGKGPIPTSNDTLFVTDRFNEDLDSDVVKIYVMDEEVDFNSRPFEARRLNDRRMCFSHTLLGIGAGLFMVMTGMMIVSSLLISRSNRLISLERYFSNKSTAQPRGDRNRL